ncbi:hypothetical protein PMNALOAF_2733 [Methylobacterium adhaesivum]|uniref:ArsR family transcriptional regulator n=1 Tax=Methylobacterium adhaesivum TaxID=333297 RepID=A0ABT8BLL7_9HYPH|nr:hypothetical protein [Methylobacterium adhaesivum]MDN3592088.1 hypothetical protein [Methylobacterium adhaesivum]GJD31474.1 hypothetical protein PMNALOAF_2733 [Methylobacterium adhaesivum]
MNALPTSPAEQSVGPYPLAPGAKERGGASAASAAMISGRAATLRARVIVALAMAGNMTADETAALLGESVLSVRPRFTELFALGEIEKTAERRPNTSGHDATVWKLTPTATRKFA